jgi:hypothetical protein
MEYLLIAGALVCVFFMCICSYYAGKEKGAENISEHECVCPKTKEQAVEDVNDESFNMNQSIDSLMTYSMEVALEAIKKER